MRIKMIKCDICKKEITGNPFKFSVAQEDRESVGTLFDLEGEVLDRSVELYDYDYCPDCVRRMMRRLMGKPAIINPEFDQAVDEMIKEGKEKKNEEPEQEESDDRVIIQKQIQELQERIQEKIQDDESEPEQKEGKTVLQYFEEAKAKLQEEERKETFTERLEREEAEKQDAPAKKNKPGVGKSIDVGKFRALCEAGWKLKDLSVEFGVSEQTISAWKKKFL